MSRIALTGASGFVGGALLARLAAEGRQPVALLRRPSSALPAGSEARVAGDLAAGLAGGQASQPATGRDDDPASQLAGAPDLRPLFAGVDVLVHAAARVHVMQEQASDPLAEFRRLNVAASARLARQAAEAGVRRLVFLSSIKVNGEATAPGQRFRADDPPAPEDAYGRSKLEAERALWQVAADTGLELVVLRPPLVYGPGVKGNIARLLGWLRRGRPLPFAAVDNRRSLVALDNLVDLLCRVAVHPAAAGQTLLAADGQDLSTPQLIRGLARGLGRPARLLPVPVPLLRLAGRLAGQAASLERLLGSLQVNIAPTCARLDWTPPVAVDEALARCAAGVAP